jgi:hypothetical protein
MSLVFGETVDRRLLEHGEQERGACKEQDEERTISSGMIVEKSAR